MAHQSPRSEERRRAAHKKRRVMIWLLGILFVLVAGRLAFGLLPDFTEKPLELACVAPGTDINKQPYDEVARTPYTVVVPANCATRWQKRPLGSPAFYWDPDAVVKHRMKFANASYTNPSELDPAEELLYDQTKDEDGDGAVDKINAVAFVNDNAFPVKVTIYAR